MESRLSIPYDETGCVEMLIEIEHKQMTIEGVEPTWVDDEYDWAISLYQKLKGSVIIILEIQAWYHMIHINFLHGIRFPCCQGRIQEFILGGAKPRVPNRKLRAKPESRARSARVSRAKPESRARSARELRAKPEPRAKPEKKRGEGSGEGAR